VKFKLDSSVISGELEAGKNMGVREEGRRKKGFVEEQNDAVLRGFFF
jgi:hypothetical protein